MAIVLVDDEQSRVRARGSVRARRHCRRRLHGLRAHRALATTGEPHGCVPGGGRVSVVSRRADRVEPLVDLHRGVRPRRSRVRPVLRTSPHPSDRALRDALRSRIPLDRGGRSSSGSHSRSRWWTRRRTRSARAARRTHSRSPTRRAPVGTLEAIDTAAGIVLSLVAVALLVRRWRRASRTLRRALWPVLIAGAAALGALVIDGALDQLVSRGAADAVCARLPRVLRGRSDRVPARDPAHPARAFVGVGARRRPRGGRAASRRARRSSR